MAGIGGIGEKINYWPKEDPMELKKKKIIQISVSWGMSGDLDF